MGDMSFKKYKCPKCNLTKHVILKKHREKSNQYLCKSCMRYFSIHKENINSKELMNLHLDGMSFRDISRHTGISKSQVHRRVYEELLKIPDNNKFSFTYCSRYSGIFEFDATYINVKGYERGIAMLWGVDYFHHDFPVITFARGETMRSWGLHFEIYRILNHYPEYIVCDDNQSLKVKAKEKFPKVKIQMCYNHLKEGIRRELKVRSDPTYRRFCYDLFRVFDLKRSEEDFDKKIFNLFIRYKQDTICTKILVQISKQKEELLAFRSIRQAPVTTNMIEGFHQQIKDRVQSIHRFESFTHAKLWMNAFVMKRRYTKFVSCKGHFYHLNGKTPLQQTKKRDIDLPTFF